MKNKNYLKTLAVLPLVIILAGCSGNVKKFTPAEFGNLVDKICPADRTASAGLIELPENAYSKMSGAQALSFSNNMGDFVTKIAPVLGDIAKAGIENSSKGGCSAVITPLQCHVSCGGADTPGADKTVSDNSANE